MVIHHAHARCVPACRVVVRAVATRPTREACPGGGSRGVPEAFEARRIMLAQHAPRSPGAASRAVRRIREIRSQRYEALMRGFFQGSSDAGDGATAEARLRSVIVPEGAAGSGAASASSAWRSSARCRRCVGGISARSRRAAETRIESGDVIVLLGVPGSLEAAEERLFGGFDPP